ncbi:hypothetical protein EW146_g461 [Bondarzewia mesenterica]|uniref:RINT-1 family protein n=1 Tax=Bondarzewia mesenterica TaxID=1095465 RepID=A0A4S4M6U3_9AGAM|nr:hypothetical protein EW146_g461 [Bondarzewia mesenterica]
MAALQIQELLKPANIEVSRRQALDKLNSWNSRDIASLAAVVDSARTQRDSLQSSLAESERNLDALIAETRTSVSEHLHSAQELSLLRHSLADELSSLTSELVSSMSDDQRTPTLLEDIESMHRNLKELESIKAYVQVVQQALKLSESAVEEIRTVNPISVSKYESLQVFVSSVTTTCSQVSEVTGQLNGGLRLVSYLEELEERTWSNMRDALSAVLLSVLEKLQWPMLVNFFSASEEDRKAFQMAFLDLLRLQEIGERMHTSTKAKSEKDGLYPIQALVQPISLRFKYHFEGSRQTNRLDKPEWYFTHILDASHKHRPFMEDVVQKLLSTTKYRDINAWAEFTYSLLPILARHLRKSMPSLLPHPPLLAHTIYQALSFDAAMKEEGFSLAGTMAGRYAEDKAWEGISEVVLGRKAWFEHWVEGERQFALDQYHEIIGSPDAWLIADDDTSSEESPAVNRELRPTNSARRLKSLVEQVTDRYTPIPQFSQRARFLIHVQLPLLEMYHGRIASSLDAFETLSSTLVRAVPGALSGDGRDKGRLTSGVEGVMRLCKALVSAKFVSDAMEVWGEDVFFLELWAEINRRASLRVRAETHPALPDPKDMSTEAPDGTIFEELIQQYEKLVSRAEDIIVQQVYGEVEGTLKAHLLSQGEPSPDPSASNIVISPTLLPALSLLSSHLSFLERTLPHGTVLSIYRHVAARLSTHILQRTILYRGHHRLTLEEGKVIHGECRLWVETCRQALGSIGTSSKGRVEAPWRRLLEAGQTIGAEGERWDGIVQASFGPMKDSAWEARMAELVDGTELSREEVCMIAKTRTDCDH